MTPTSADAIALALETLAAARDNLGRNPSRTTIGEAYQSMYWVARAFVEERTGKSPKTHKGLITVLGALTRGLPEADRDTLGMLATGLNQRMIADYDDPRRFAPVHAEAALDYADAFVALCSHLLRD